MTGDVLQVAVVGHTNTGKTSLMRTLTRDPEFGEVSDRPAVTRHVEGRALLVHGRAVMELYDTPGLEDSISLLDHLQEVRGDRRVEGLEVLRQFLTSEEAAGRYAQEAKTINQVLESDIAFYVIDVRDRVLGKHRDELEILAWCARPVVPVLNFVAASDARTDVWREHLSRANMHAVTEFDTVVLDEECENRLYEKMRTLLDSHRDTLNLLIEDRKRQRADLVRASARLIAKLLIDVAAHAVTVPTKDRTRAEEAVEGLRQGVRVEEQQVVDRLLDLFHFRAEDVAGEDIPVEDGRWGLDLFSPEALMDFGLQASSGAAKGAAVGLGLDIMLGGLSLGTGTAAGAAVGALWGAGSRQARRLFDMARGNTELRCNDETLRLLGLRSILLVRALLRRGHASVQPVLIDADTKAKDKHKHAELPAPLRQAKVNPDWSSIVPSPHSPGSDARRQAAEDELTTEIERLLLQSDDQPVHFP